MKSDTRAATISWVAIREMLNNARRVSRIIWKENKGGVILLALIFLIVSGSPFISSGALAYLINQLIEGATQGAVTSSLWFALAVFVVASIIPSILYAYQEYLSKQFYLFITEQMEFLSIRKKGEIDVATHEDPAFNNLFQKLSESGMWRVQNFVDRQFYIFQNVAEVLIASVIIVSFQWWVFIVVLLGTIPELWVEILYGKSVWSIYEGRTETRRRFWELKRHFERTAPLVELRLFQNIGHFLSKIKKLLSDFRKEEQAVERRRLLLRLSVLFLSQVVIAFAAVWFVFEVVGGIILVGTLTFVLASVRQLRQSLSGLFANLGRQYQDSLFVTDAFRFLDTPPKLEIPRNGVVLSKKHTPEIQFDHVTFRYPGTDKVALRDFSLRIEPGEKVALVGTNGAGKTTFVKLLCRFYDPDSGRVLIGGHDLRTIDLESWYAHLGVLFQDFSSYYSLVKDVIGLGRTAVPLSMPNVKSAARSSESDIFIEEWEKQYGQMLGKHFSEGVEPSFGQWQKIALARTFYRDARVLILDEPTSSIDAEAEAKIFDRLEALPSDRSVILISHRFSTVRHATKIVVIEKGALKELGTHRELLKKNGIYARLFKLQAKGYR